MSGDKAGVPPAYRSGQIGGRQNADLAALCRACTCRQQQQWPPACSPASTQMKYWAVNTTVGS